MSSVSLCAIDLFLNNANHTIPVGVYKEIPVLELKKLISSAFVLPDKVDVVGVHQMQAANDQKNANNPIIPLSFISRNPKAIDVGAKYQIITNNGTVASTPSLFALFKKYWISILIATSICFILLPSIIYLMPEYVLLHRPILRNIYRNGPSYKIPVLSADLGFWNGKEINVICSEVSGQSSGFWNKNSNECKQLVSQKMGGFIILIETVISVYLICQIF
eukprot:UN01295